MKALLAKLAHLAGQDSVRLGAFDPSTLFGDAPHEFAPVAREYFGECVPHATLDLNFHRILADEDIRAENQDLIPSYFCVPHGFITIATDLGGNAYSVDVTDGKVYHLSHDTYESDGIHPGWNSDHTEFLPPLPVSRQNIINTSKGFWESIPEFLQECLEYAASGK